jgi:hypothetical protein
LTQWVHAGFSLVHLILAAAQASQLFRNFALLATSSRQVSEGMAGFSFMFMRQIRQQRPGRWALPRVLLPSLAMVVRLVMSRKRATSCYKLMIGRENIESCINLRWIINH